jgi:hypothetical protein
MWKSILPVLAVLALVGCSKRATDAGQPTDAGKLIEATDPNCKKVNETCGVQIGPDPTALQITLPDGSRLLLFAGVRNAAGDYVDACIDAEAISDNNWVSGAKHGNVALWVPLRSCNP